MLDKSLEHEKFSLPVGINAVEAVRLTRELQRDDSEEKV
jgi:hypothetical protein